jgi:hypothetical protein
MDIALFFVLGQAISSKADPINSIPMGVLSLPLLIGFFMIILKYSTQLKSNIDEKTKRNFNTIIWALSLVCWIAIIIIDHGKYDSTYFMPRILVISTFILISTIYLLPGNIPHGDKSAQYRYIICVKLCILIIGIIFFNMKKHTIYSKTINIIQSQTMRMHDFYSIRYIHYPYYRI